MAVLKKSAGLGGGMADVESVAELAESYVLLMTVTGFLEAEGEKDVKRSPLKAFT